MVSTPITPLVLAVCAEQEFRTNMTHITPCCAKSLCLFIGRQLLSRGDLRDIGEDGVPQARVKVLNLMN